MKRALISVSDKTNLVDFAKGLVRNGYEIISTFRQLADLHIRSRMRWIAFAADNYA